GEKGGERRDGRHHHGPEPPLARAQDGFGTGGSFVELRLRFLEQEDAVLDDEADEKDRAHERRSVELSVRREQRQEAADDRDGHRADDEQGEAQPAKLGGENRENE